MTTATEVAPRRIYVWELPVRLTHWLIVGSVVVLAATGIYMGRPFITVTGEARDHFVMGTMRVVHFYAAIVFTLSVISRVVWMFRGNRFASWRQFVPVDGERRRGMLETFKFYLFVRSRPVPGVGHNPLAGAAYVAVFFLYFVQIVTGLALYGAGASVGSWLGGFDFLIPVVGGLQTARFVHHIAMWLILGFVAHHVWSGIEVSLVEKNNTLESIVTGYKTVAPDDTEATHGD